MATLKHRWIYSMPESFYMGDTGIVDICVQVRADGTFLNPDPKVERSSGKVALDDAAVAAIRASAPFPHFPSGFEGASIELRISFFYNVPVKKPDPILVPAKPHAPGESPK
jgi:TonB family protein